MFTISSIPPGRLAIVLCLTLTAISVPASAANLVKNGGFEDIFGRTSSFHISWPDPTYGGRIADWNFPFAPFSCLSYDSANPVCSAGLDLWIHPGKSPDGGNTLAIDSDPELAKPFSQEISGLTVGENYKLTFYQASGQFTTRTGDTTELWEVKFGTETQRSTMMITPSQGSIGWMQEVMFFTAHSTAQTLSFFAVGTPSGLPPVNLLDGVVLEADVPGVPEPATFAMIGIGLLALPVVSRIRNRRRQ
jgi:hypothetical protein